MNGKSEQSGEENLRREVAVSSPFNRRNVERSDAKIEQTQKVAQIATFRTIAVVNLTSKLQSKIDVHSEYFLNSRLANHSRLESNTRFHNINAQTFHPFNPLYR